MHTWLDSIAQDTSFALRGFRKHPAFTFIVVLTLAIGIGATTAVFSVVDPLLFRSLPYAHANRLVSFGFVGPVEPNEFMLGKEYVQWHKLFTPFESVTTMSASYRASFGTRDSVDAHCVPVQANLLSTLGVPVAAGRDFNEQDDNPNAPGVALLSFDRWQASYGGSTSILGHTIVLDDTPVRVVGILPRNFELPTGETADILIPQRLDPVEQLRSYTGRALRSFGRLKPGVSIEQARGQMQPFFEHVLPDVPPQLRKEVHMVVRGLRDRQFHDVRLASCMLLGAALSLLLLASANVGNLLLARAAARQTELAVRAALGAGRLRLVRQGLTESMLLAFCGGIAGCALAWLLFRILGTLPPESVFRLRESMLDARLLLIAVLTSVTSAIVFGIAPALPAQQANASNQSRAGTARSLLRNILITVQIAVSIVLLTGASLLTRSLWKLETQPIGFQPAHTIAVSLGLNRHRYNTREKLDVAYVELESKLRASAGPAAYALTDTVPPGGEAHERPFSNMAVVGAPPLPSEGGAVKFRYITPGYFGVLRIPILIGRGFVERDRVTSEHTVVLSASLARRMFGASNPLGHQVVLSETRVPYTVIGVAGDVKNDGLASAPMPEYYIVRKPHNDFTMSTSAVALFRSSQSSQAFEPWIRSQLAALDPNMTMTISTLADVVSNENRRPKFLAVLIGLFAAFGLVLSAVGLYGVVSFLVSQQTREIGVRMAIGATPALIAKLVLSYALLRAGMGIAAGLLIYFALARSARALLFDISPTDPISLTVSLGLLLGTTLLAAWRPSHRAAQIDPSIALRYE